MTDLKAWLKGERGRSVALARHLGVGKARITQMADAGVPRPYLLRVRDFTGGAVSLEALLKDTAPTSAMEATAAEGLQ